MKPTVASLTAVLHNARSAREPGAAGAEIDEGAAGAGG
jgi:hypothetical protein